MIDLEIVKPGKTIRIPFGTYDGGDGRSLTMTGFVAADVQIYKDGGTTQRASAAGITATTDFSGEVGIHTLFINLADNTTANFYEAGSEYLVIVGPVTIDTQTVNLPVARFEIGYKDAILNTTIATLSSQTSFTLEDGSLLASAYRGCTILVHQLDDEFDVAIGYISQYAVTTKTITLSADPDGHVMIAGDHVAIFMPANVEAWKRELVVAPNTPGVPVIDVIRMVGGLVPVPTTTGVPDVNVQRWLDTLVTLSGALPDINVETMDTDSIAAAAIASAAIDKIRDAIISDATTFPGASITELRMAELDPANLPTDIAAVPTAVENRIEMDSNSVDLNSLLTLITAARMGALDDWIEAGRLDVLLDAIKAITDQFVFTTLNQVDSQPISMAANVITAAALATDAINKIRDGMAVATGVAQAGSTANDIIMAAGESSVDDNFKDQWIVMEPGSTKEETRLCTGYNGTSKTATVEPAWKTTPLVGDAYRVIPAARIATFADAGISAATIAASALNGKGDWNIGKTGYSLTQAFPGNFASMGIEADGHVHGDIKEWLSVAPGALIGGAGGRIDASVGAMAANVLNAAAINAGAITSAKFAAGAIDAAAIGTGAIDADSIAANAITAVKIAANAITAAKIATDAITSSQFAVSAAEKIRDEILPVTNVALPNIPFIFVAASDHVTPVTGATGVTGERSIDGGAYVGVSGTITEVSDGSYQFDALAADMNGGIITFKFSATGGTPGAADDTFVSIVTNIGV